MPPFAALADDTRVAIVRSLAQSERSVGELVELFPISQPAISRHLKVLREAGLVDVRIDAQRRIYRLNPRPLHELDRWLADYRHLWARRLTALEKHLDDNPA